MTLEHRPYIWMSLGDHCAHIDAWRDLEAKKRLDEYAKLAAWETTVFYDAEYDDTHFTAITQVGTMGALQTPTAITIRQNEAQGRLASMFHAAKNIAPLTFK